MIMNRWTARNRVDKKFMAYSTGSSLSLALGKQPWHVINDSPVSLKIAFIEPGVSSSCGTSPISGKKYVCLVDVFTTAHFPVF